MPPVTTISLLLPTRSRKPLVEKLFDSIMETTANPSAIEVVLYMDEDDLPSHTISHPSLRIVKLIKQRNTMGNINRTCYEACRGRYVMLLNDDVQFRTRGWDSAVLQAFAQFPDDIALVYGNDLIFGRHLAAFPITSRTVCNLLGGICPPEYRRDFIDVHLLDIFKRLSNIGYDRIVYLKEVIFEHMHYFGGKAKLDETYLSNRDGSFDDILFLSLYEERQQNALRLAHCISKYKGISPHGKNNTPEYNPKPGSYLQGDRFISHQVALNSRLGNIARVASVVKETCFKMLTDTGPPISWRLKLLVWIVARQLFVRNESSFIWRLKSSLWTISQWVFRRGNLCTHHDEKKDIGSHSCL